MKTKRKIRKDIFEIHKPSALVAAEYKITVIKNGRRPTLEHYSLTPIQHDAMNYMCYSARDQIYRIPNIKKILNDFETQDDLMQFLEVQVFETSLNDIATFAGKYEAKQNKKELSTILDMLQSVKIKAGVFKKDNILGEIQAEKNMVLLRNYTTFPNSNKITYQLEPEILIGWIYKPNPYVKLYLKIQTLLKLSYSKILYEICKDYIVTGGVTKELSEWVKALNFDPEIKATKTVGQFKQTYLNKAVKEINEKTDIKITSIKGKKANGILTMEVLCESQECDLITEDMFEKSKSIDTHKHYKRAKKKLDNLIKFRDYQVYDEDMWIENDIKTFEKEYDSQDRIDRWVNENTKEDKEYIFEYVAKRSEICYDPTVFLDTDKYQLKSVYTLDPITHNAQQTLDTINSVIEEINNG